MIPKTRMDALTDGVFAVAMTLLVIDLKLPESFHPADAAELLHRLGELWPQALVYIVSFYVLGLRWVGLVQMTARGEEVGEEYARWAMVNLLLVTFVPFTTMCVARYVALAPAIWLYAINTMLFALIALRMMTLTDRAKLQERMLEHRLGLLVLIGASVLTMAVSLVAPRWAMLAYFTNALDGPLRRLLVRHRRIQAA